jgi:DNA-directed RNA polymerase subunit RPC12/RpoP
MEHLQTIRNMLNSLSIFEGNGNKNGPTSREYIQNLTQTTFIELMDKMNINDFANKKCAICTDEFEKDEKISSLDCKHFFHSECLIPWLEIQNTCPNCRFMLPKAKEEDP